jgi:hypothetical protein
MPDDLQQWQQAILTKTKPTRTLTRKAIKRAIEDAVLLGTDYGHRKIPVSVLLERQKQLIEDLLQ